MQRLTLAFSIAAFLVAILGWTPVGEGRASRCIRVSGAVLSEIDDGMRSGYQIASWPLYAVRSRKYVHPWYMISARVVWRSGSQHLYFVATWATNRLDGHGLMFSAERLAAVASDWGRLPGSSITTDGVGQSRDCMRS